MSWENDITKAKMKFETATKASSDRESESQRIYSDLHGYFEDVFQTSAKLVNWQYNVELHDGFRTYFALLKTTFSDDSGVFASLRKWPGSKCRFLLSTFPHGGHYYYEHEIEVSDLANNRDMLKDELRKMYNIYVDKYGPRE